METLQIGTFTRQVPSTWHELSRQQLLRLLPEVYAKPTPDRRLRLLGALSGYPLPLLAGLSPVVLGQLLPLTDWLASEQHRLTDQLLPTLAVERRAGQRATWHGPLGQLRNLLFGEFMFADTFFVLYCLHGQAAALDQFLTVLYRPARAGADPDAPDWNGDVRLPFNEHQLERRSPKVAQVSYVQKLAILTWYRGCRAQLADEFPDVFAAAEEDAGGRAKQAPDWGRVLRKLSGGAFGPVQQTAQQPLRLVLAEVQDAAADYQRLKKQSSHA
ncbi:MAG: hypothetical protein ACRYF0_16595 [Janthinobacterium lividum]